MPSPPPQNNFDVVPRVRSVEPMKDIRREVGARSRPVETVAQPVAPRSLLMRLLVLATAIAVTFVLIVVGGIVRVSDSGLGCGKAARGFHGWPFCKGDVVPGVSLHSVIEYCHRTAAGIVSVLIVATRASGLAALPRLPRVRRPGCSLLVIAQAVLGAATVEERPEGDARGRPPGPRDAAVRRPHLPVRRNVSGRDAATYGGPGCARCRSPRAWRCCARSSPAATWPAPSTTAARTSARRRRAPCLRQGVPELQRRVHAVRPGDSWTSTSTHRAFVYLASLLVIAPGDRCDPARGAHAASAWGLARAAGRCRSRSAH